MRPRTRTINEAEVQGGLVPILGTEKEIIDLLYGDKFPFKLVDLGLSDGTLWASCNLGANSPEEYGDYYQWGALEGHDSSYNFNRTTYKNVELHVSYDEQYAAPYKQYANTNDLRKYDCLLKPADDIIQKNINSYAIYLDK